MAHFKKIACFVLLLLQYQITLAIEPISAISISIGIVTGVIKFTQQLWKGLKLGSRMLGEDPDSNIAHYKRPLDTTERNLMDELIYLSVKADQLRLDLENMKDEVTYHVTKIVPGLVELNRRLSIIFVNTLDVGKYYNNFLGYVRSPQSYDRNILVDFATKTISEDTCGLNHLLDEIHTLLTLSDVSTPSAINLLVNHMELFLEYTKVAKSPQQLLHNLLSSVIYAEVKGYLTIRFSYELLDLYHGGNYGAHLEKTTFDFANRINRTVSAFKKAMSRVSTEIWVHDPVYQIEDVTYSELKNVFQEYIVNEADISTYDNCWHSCSSYKTPTEKLANNCRYEEEICAHQRYCDGYIYDCRYKVDTDMYICPSNKNSSRRYQYIDYGNGLRYGLKDEKCDVDPVETGRHYSASNVRWCDPCMCICATTGPSAERYFNIKPSMSRYWENYVITGARLVKKNNTVHIQIQEGELLPSGNINEKTIAWAPIDENPKQLHVITWDKSREINLDDLHAEKGHVLIGLSFSSEDTGPETKRLHLKIFSAELNFTSGRLVPGSQQEAISLPSNDEIKLNSLDVPTRTAVLATLKSQTNQYLKFTTTGLMLDVGQSTIPFIDIQNITTNPSTLIAGAGIYHKRRTGNGGYLSLKLFTYNVEPHLQADLEY